MIGISFVLCIFAGIFLFRGKPWVGAGLFFLAVALTWGTALVK